MQTSHRRWPLGHSPGKPQARHYRTGEDPCLETLATGELHYIAGTSLEILRTTASHKARRLPVIDGHTLVGMVAPADVARAPPDAPVGDLLDALTGD
ncbi:hypothetical protein ACLQ2R_04925 [Streptosporangium sp. DT93]|uniref:hypothetical protein n=1 Tax=Streptosporangium sp. DT93 TaxID=3393428 RepID=UPI003CF710A6